MMSYSIFGVSRSSTFDLKKFRNKIIILKIFLRRIKFISGVVISETHIIETTHCTSARLSIIEIITQLMNFTLLDCILILFFRVEPFSNQKYSS